MKRIFALTSLAAIALVSSSSVFAGNKGNEVTVSAMESYYHFADKRAMDNVAVPTLAVAYNFDPKWAIEAAAGLVNTNINPPKVPTQRGVHGFLYTVDGLYRFLVYGPLEPYVSFGVGMTSFQYPTGTSEAKHQANLNAGLGTQIFFHDFIAFRAEARDIYTMSGGKNDVQLGLGLSFLFDGCCHCQSPVVSYKNESYKGEG